MDVNDRAGHGDTQRRFRLLLPSTQRALSRNGIWTDTAIATLSDRDLLQLAGIGPAGRQDIRQHFPQARRWVAWCSHSRTVDSPAE